MFHDHDRAGTSVASKWKRIRKTPAYNLLIKIKLDLYMIKGSSDKIKQAAHPFRLFRRFLYEKSAREGTIPPLASHRPLPRLLLKAIVRQFDRRVDHSVIRSVMINWSVGNFFYHIYIFKMKKSRISPLSSYGRSISPNGTWVAAFCFHENPLCSE